MSSTLPDGFVERLTILTTVLPKLTLLCMQFTSRSSDCSPCNQWENWQHCLFHIVTSKLVHVTCLSNRSSSVCSADGLSTLADNVGYISYLSRRKVFVLCEFIYDRRFCTRLEWLHEKVQSDREVPCIDSELHNIWAFRVNVCLVRRRPTASEKPLEWLRNAHCYARDTMPTGSVVAKVRRDR